jgi:DMSO/TMAO reductase YedYZ heme-binding membrane subunit
MSEVTVRLFVESWAVCWTLVLGLGYVGRVLMWPELESLGSDTIARLMVLASIVAVMALCFAGFSAAGFTITGWAIGLSLIRSLVLSGD